MTREQIGRVALELADREGIEALTMRRLGHELGIGTMTLYRYFRDKEELLDLMVDTAAAAGPAAADSGGPWQEELRRLFRGVHATLAKHPVALPLRLRGPILSSGALRVTEIGMQILQRAGFDRAAAAHAYRCLFLYTFGHASFNSPEAPEEVKRDTRAKLMALPPDEFPALSSSAGEAAETMAGESQFEFGLDRLLDGLEAMLAQPGAGGE